MPLLSHATPFHSSCALVVLGAIHAGPSMAKELQPAPDVIRFVYAQPGDIPKDRVVQTSGNVEISDSTLTFDRIDIAGGRVEHPEHGAEENTLSIERSGVLLSTGIGLGQGRGVISKSLVESDIGLDANPPMSDITHSDPRVRLRIENESRVVGTIRSPRGSAVEIDRSEVDQSKRVGEPAFRVSGSTVLATDSQFQGATALEIVGDDVPARVHLIESTATGRDDAAIVVRDGTPGQQVSIFADHGSALEGKAGEMLRIEDSYRGSVGLIADNSALAGNLRGNGRATFFVSLQNDSIMSGEMHGVDNLDVLDSKWRLSGDSDVGLMRIANGLLDTGGHTLEVGSLTGTAGRLNADIRHLDTAPAIRVRDRLSGHWRVMLTDSQPDKPDATLRSRYVVVAANGESTATASGDTDIGAWRYSGTTDRHGNIIVTREPDSQTDAQPRPQTDSQPASSPNPEHDSKAEVATQPDLNAPAAPGGHAVALPVRAVPDAKCIQGTSRPRLSASAIAAVNSMSLSAARAVWDAQLGALHNRQQDLRDVPTGKGTVWIQPYFGRERLANGYAAGKAYSFDAAVGGLLVGVDAVLHRGADSMLNGGLFASVASSRRLSAESTGGSRGHTLGLYGTWASASGWYVESVLAWGQFTKSFEAKPAGAPTSGVMATIPANAWRAGTTAAFAEIGRRWEFDGGWRVQPAIGLRHVHEGHQLTTTGLRQKVQAAGASGVAVHGALTIATTWRSAGIRCDPWVRAGYIGPIRGTRITRFAGATIATVPDTSRVFASVGMSVNLAKHHSMFADCLYESAGQVGSLTSVNVGYRLRF